MFINVPTHQTGHGHLIDACARLRIPPDPLWLRDPSAAVTVSPSTSEQCSEAESHGRLLRSAQRYSAAARLRRRLQLPTSYTASSGATCNMPGSSSGPTEDVKEEGMSEHSISSMGGSIRSTGGTKSGFIRRLCISSAQVRGIPSCGALSLPYPWLMELQPFNQGGPEHEWILTSFLPSIRGVSKV